MTTKFQDTPLTILQSILMFPDTQNYIGSEYPGLIQRIEKVVNEQDVSQAQIAKIQVELGKLKSENELRDAEIARYRTALEKSNEFVRCEAFDYHANRNHPLGFWECDFLTCSRAAKIIKDNNEALQAQEVAK